MKNLLDEWFPNKKYVLVINRTNSNNLSYQSHLIYSYLVFRKRKKQTTTKSTLTKILGLDRRKVPDLLKELLDIKLIKQIDNKTYEANSPKDVIGWFGYKKKKVDHWFDSFAAYRLYIPSKKSPLTKDTNGLLFMLYSLAGRWSQRPIVSHQTISGLSKLVGSSEKTMRRGENTLIDNKFILKSPYTFELLKPSEEMLVYWIDRPKIALPPVKKAFSLSQVLSLDKLDYAKWIDKWGTKMLQCRYSEEQIRDYWKEALQQLKTPSNDKGIDWVFNFAVCGYFEDAFLDAEYLHQQSGKASNSRYALKNNTPDAVEGAKNHSNPL